MFRPIKNKIICEKVIEQIKEMLSDRSLKKGQKLSSERQMVENLQISRASVRETI
jgi:GntR family transcriptional repressor for pyruvate dehydrogenase complex